MNLGAYRTAVNRRSGVYVADAALNDLINEALQTVALEKSWPWLLTTTTFTAAANDQEYALPADISRVVAVSIDNLEYKPISNIESALWHDSVMRRGFTVIDETLVIWPVPSVAGGAGVITYVQRENILTADGEEPLLPSEYDTAIVHLACSLVHDRSGDKTKADQFEGRYRDFVTRMARSALYRGGRPILRIRPW